MLSRSQEYLLPVDQAEKLEAQEAALGELKARQERELHQIKVQQAEFGYNLLANISLLAQVALSLVENYPQASDLSLQISNIIDELGVFAQWLIGKEQSAEIFKKGKTLNDLFNAANAQCEDQGRN